MSSPKHAPPEPISSPQEDAGEDAQRVRTSFNSLRIRTFLIGIPLLIFVSVLSVYADMSAQVIQFGVLQFSPPAVVALFALAFFNSLWQRVRGQAFLSRTELLIIYAMLLVGVMVSTRGVVEKVVGSIAYLPYAVAGGRPEFKLFLLHMPRWTVPYDPANALPPSDVIRGFYEGSRGPIPWSAWIGPLCADFAAFAGVILVFLGMATILRRQWVDVERLSFPLTSLPIAVIQNDTDGRPLFSNPLLWAGIAIPTLIFGVNGLHANFPAIPEILMRFDMKPFLQSPPWNGVEFCTAFLSLAVVGFAYFIPGDILFSLWFFYILVNTQAVTAAAVGYPSNASGQWPSYEAAGAYFVIAAAIYWQARPLLKGVWLKALGRSGEGVPDDSKELMPYRWALLCIGVGFAGLMVWMTATGMSLWLAALQIGIYVFVVALVMTRAVAQAGLLMTETSFLPQMILQMFVPLNSLGPANLTTLVVTDTFFAQDLRGQLMSPFLDVQATAGRIGARCRMLLTPLVTGVVVSLVAASITFVHLNYTVGGNLLYGHPHDVADYEMSSLVASIHGQAAAPVGPAVGSFVAGLALAVGLTVMRARFAWFPLHPLGLALCPSWSMKVFWFGFLVAWVLRTLLLRYGGIRSYRQFTPLMIGLIVGEFSSAVFWACLHLAYKVTAPAFPWP